MHSTGTLGPLQAPFALRLHRLGDTEAHVFTPDVHREYSEDGLYDDLMAAKGHVYQAVRRVEEVEFTPAGVPVMTPEHLKSIWLFARVPDEELAEVCRLFVASNYAEGEVIDRKSVV